MAPISAPKMTWPSTMSGEMIPVPTVCATCKSEEQERDEVEECRPDDRNIRRKHPRRDHRRDRIGGVVQAVEKIENESDRDEGGKQHERIRHRKKAPGPVQTCSMTMP